MIDIAKLKKNIENDSINKYKEECKDSLKKSVSKKILTATIGSLDAIEKTLGELWNHGGKPENKDQEELFELYTKLRKQILDLGNIQIKKLDEELNNYDVELKRYSYSVPLIKK